MAAEVICQKKEKRGLDVETVLVAAITAFAGGIGIIAIFAVLTGADIHDWNMRRMLGGYLLISTLLWGFLILREFCSGKHHDI